MTGRAEQTSASAHRQLVLDLAFRPAQGREDFLVAPCNRVAVRAIDRWPDWPGGRLAIAGPAGSGKTHLARVWQARSDAVFLEAKDLSSGAVMGEAVRRGAVVVENGDRLGDERALLHLFNLMTETGGSLLVSGRQPPARWPVRLPDLASRLSTLPVVSLTAPDDDLLVGVMAKLFKDRQIDLTQDLATYLVRRIERSFDAARRVVEALDKASLARKSPLTRRLVAEVLAELMDEARGNSP